LENKVSNDMTKTKWIITLAKVIVAAAWADGEVSSEEMNSLKDLLFGISNLTASDWAELEIYIDSPIDEKERDRLIAELQNAIASPQEKALALSAIDEVILADGVITDAEKAAAEEIKEAIQTISVGILPQMARLMKGPVQRRQKVFEAGPNRELYLEDYLKNRIYYEVRRRLDLGEAELDLPESELRKLSSAGGLLARVAHVDKDVKDEEYASIMKSLQNEWNLRDREAGFVTQVAISTFSEDLDFFRLTRCFFESTTGVERERFLDALFAVASADEDISFDETEEIRKIARGLKLSHRQFIDAKMKAKD
jgi:uncharacterized tellurite resistance protein B-like protein